MLELRNSQERKKVLLDNTLVCIDIGATWCGPCQSIAPKFAKMVKRYNDPGKVLLVKEDLDLKLTKDYQVTSIPTFLFYQNGKLLKNEVIIGSNLKMVESTLNRLTQ